MNEQEEAKKSILLTMARLVVFGALMFCLWAVIHNILRVGGRWWFNLDLLKMNAKYIIIAFVAATCCNYLDGKIPKDKEEEEA